MRSLYFDIPEEDRQVCILLERIASAHRRGNSVWVIYTDGGKETFEFLSGDEAKKIYAGIKSEIQRP